jgi:TRAP transporter TAXI family solute receptor
MKCDFCKIGIPAVVIIIVAIIVAYQFTDPLPPKTLRMATGKEGGGYHTYTLAYQKYLADQKFHLEILPTAGSVEVLKKLKAGEVSVGLVQGGTGNTVTPEGLETIASLFYEPLWIFHRQELSFQYLFELRGKRIAVGEEGSGTRPLALQLLGDNNVTETNSTFFGLAYKVAAQQLIAGEIDAAFFIMPTNGAIVKELLEAPGIELFSFKQDLAYTSRYPYLTTVKLGEGVISLEKNIPDKDKTLLAATASLVARENLHPDIVHLLLMSLIAVHHKGGLLEKINQFPSDKFVEFPMNANAASYLKDGPSLLHKIFPFWIAATLDHLKIMLIPLIAIIMPLLKGILPIYRWKIRSNIYRWYALLREVDQKLDDTNDLEVIQQEIRRMRILQKELVDQVSVPLSYMGEFYGLQLHIRLILNRLEERQHELNKDVSHI